MIRRLSGRESRGAWAKIAELHIEAVPQGFLTTLGPRVLASVYRSIASSRSSFLLAAECDGEVEGFICGAYDVGKVYRDYLVRHGLEAALLLLPVIFAPKRAHRLIETLRYPGTGGGVKRPEILSFCVSSASRGQGIGRSLLLGLIQEFRTSGVRDIRVVTGETQHAAHRLYEALGASQSRRIQVHEGVWSREYTLPITSRSR